MTRDALIVLLQGHKMAKARLEVLRTEAERMIVQINRAAMEDAAMSAMHGGGIAGASGGGGISKPVETAAIRSMDGIPSPQMRVWLEESRQMQEEIQRIERRVEPVDVALSGLRQQERIVIEQHIMEEVSWRELACMTPRLFGEHKSQGTLRGWQSDALNKLAGALEGVRM